MRNNRAYLNCLQRKEAQELWRQKLFQCGFLTGFATETVTVIKALGRVAAKSVFAKQSVPHYNGAAMDGIAVFAQDTFGAKETLPKQLKLLSEETQFSSGSCYVIDTGDPMPLGTTAVIMIEDVHLADDFAHITAAAVPWQNVRVIGEDIVVNEIVVPEQQVIAPVDIAALLAAGLEEITVIKKPETAIISTGDEIVGSLAELKPGAILDINSHMLAEAITEWGSIPKRQGIVKDDIAAVRQTIINCLEKYDVVVINAGTSAGRGDYTVEVLRELGEVIVHGVAIKPGKPVILAVCQGKPVIGLPGYPVVAMLTAELFLREILYLRQRLPIIEKPAVEAVLTKQTASTVGVEEYIRVSVGNVQGKVVAAPLNRGAGLISSLNKAQGILSIEEACPGLNSGQKAPVIMLRSEKPENTVLAVGSHDLALELLGVFLRRKLAGISLAYANVAV